MNRTFTVAILGLCFLITGFVRAEAIPASSNKVGFMDLQRTLSETKVGKEAKRRLEQTKKKRQGDLDRQQSALKKAAAQLEKQRMVLKPAVLRQREQELQRDYVKFQETYAQLQQGLMAEENKLVKEIFAKAAPAIKAVAKERGFSLILDKSSALWANNNLDITDAVNKRIR